MRRELGLIIDKPGDMARFAILCNMADRLYFPDSWYTLQWPTQMDDW
jgi:hypothetical protein